MVFYLGWAQGVPRKISCVLYFPHYLLTIESRSVSKISLIDCSRKLGKNTIHPPLVPCTLKSTLMKRVFQDPGVFPLRKNQAKIKQSKVRLEAQKVSKTDSNEPGFFLLRLSSLGGFHHHPPCLLGALDD